MGSRCTTGFHQKYRNRYLWGAITGSPSRKLCMYVCVRMCTLSWVHILNKCFGMDHPYSGQTWFNSFCFGVKLMFGVFFGISQSTLGVGLKRSQHVVRLKKVAFHFNDEKWKQLLLWRYTKQHIEHIGAILLLQTKDKRKSFLVSFVGLIVSKRVY